MIRPKLSEESFLRHLFSPAKNPLPTGIRQTKLIGTKGRVKGRLAAFNRMSPKSQEILRQADMRESYLSGQASLTEAKRALRLRANHKGYRKPRYAVKTPTSDIDAANAGYLYRAMSMAQKGVDYRQIQRNIKHLPAGQKPGFQTWSDAKIRAYASNDENIVVDNGRHINPVWYHPSNRG